MYRIMKKIKHLDYPIAGMLKDEPRTVYMYKVIKRKRGARFFIFPLKEGMTFESEDNSLDSNYYKLICSYRKAFVGNMQDRLLSREDTEKCIKKWKEEEIGDYLTNLLLTGVNNNFLTVGEYKNMDTKYGKTNNPVS